MIKVSIYKLTNTKKEIFQESQVFKNSHYIWANEVIEWVQIKINEYHKKYDFNKYDSTMFDMYFTNSRNKLLRIENMNQTYQLDYRY